MLAAAWQLDLDELRIAQELIETPHDFDILTGRIAAGTVCGQRYRWQGIVRDRPLIEIDALWNVGEAYPDHWPTTADGWTRTPMPRSRITFTPAKLPPQ